jgi:hypothetical protein
MYLVLGQLGKFRHGCLGLIVAISAVEGSLRAGGGGAGGGRGRGGGQ